jgi:dienelactone hydrolase
MTRALVVTLALMTLIAWSPPIAGAANADGWDPTLFSYDREKLVVEVTTPTAAQVAWLARPARLKIAADDLKETTSDVKPRTVGPVDILHLKFRDSDGEVVPALLATPRGKPGPFPVVIAVHGLTSNKAQVIAQLAPALAKQGFALIAPDMPRHGERAGDPYTLLDVSRPLKTFEMVRQTVRDVRVCIDVAEKRPELDTRRGVVLMGYSLGSWVNAVAGPADDRVKAMVLMVGGAHDIPIAALPIPQLRSTDPRTAIAHFSPRPLLLINAKNDMIVTPDMGKRLFEACNAKFSEQRWYDCGHLLINTAYEDAAKWVGKVFSREQAEMGKKAG